MDTPLSARGHSAGAGGEGGALGSLLISDMGYTWPDGVAVTVPSVPFRFLSLAGIRMEPRINPTIQEICETLSIKGCLTTGLLEYRAFLGLKFAGRYYREAENWSEPCRLTHSAVGFRRPLVPPPQTSPSITRAREFAFDARSVSVAL